MTKENKRGSNGGVARAANLPKEKRTSIASEAAKKRWAEVRRVKELPYLSNATVLEPLIELPELEVVPITKPSIPPSPPPPVYAPPTTQEPPEEKHCPVCMIGQSLSKGEGTHVLDTVEHPATLPTPLEDPDTSVDLPLLPQKPHKPTPAERGRSRASKEKPVAKVYKQALMIAEKEYAETVEELVYHEEMAARKKSNLPRIIQTIKALGGTIDPQAIEPQNYPNPSYNPYSGVPHIPLHFPQPTTPDLMQDSHGIDPALYQANSGPVPRSSLATQQAEMVAGVVTGGTEELDWVR